MSSANVIFVRHGQTAGNVNGIMDGQVVDIPLNQVGRRQAEGAGERLKDRRFTSVFSSDMTRTTETAQLILEQNEAGAERRVEQNIDLRERFFGMLEGLTVPDYAKALGRPEVARELRGFSFRNVTKTGRAGQLIREVFALSPPGGEDMKEFRTRAEKYLKDFLADLRALTKKNRGIPPLLLVVTHGGFLMQLFDHMVRDLGAEFKDESDRGNVLTIGNTAVTEIRFDELDSEETKITFLTVNCRRHAE